MQNVGKSLRKSFIFKAFYCFWVLLKGKGKKSLWFFGDFKKGGGGDGVWEAEETAQ